MPARMKDIKRDLTRAESYQLKSQLQMFFEQHNINIGQYAVEEAKLDVGVSMLLKHREKGGEIEVEGYVTEDLTDWIQVIITMRF